MSADAMLVIGAGVLGWLFVGFAAYLLDRHLWTEFFGYDWTTRHRKGGLYAVGAGPIYLLVTVVVDGIYALDKANAAKVKPEPRVLKRGKAGR